MNERLPDFSEEERSLIGSSALKLARIGENAIWDAVSARVRLATAKFMAGSRPLIVGIEDKTFRLTSEQVDHEILLLGEVIRQARIMLQISGEDDASIIEFYRSQPPADNCNKPLPTV